jgi:GPH family glycoside/pentoside/hexuronide:cation symporter
MVMLGILLVPQGAKLLAYVVAILVGPGIAAAHALPRAMSADTLDVDQVQSGRRQEGIYAGIEVFARKISTKVFLATVGPILAFSGYVENAATQTPGALLAIRLLIAVVPAVILLMGVILAWKYPLNREAHREVQIQLEDRGLLSRKGTGEPEELEE